MILARLIAFARYMVTLEDVRWFVGRMWHQVLDEPEERMRFGRLVVQLLGTGAVAGWVVATLFSAGGFATVPGSTTDSGPNIIAREPGPGYNVKAFCDDP